MNTRTTNSGDVITLIPQDGKLRDLASGPLVKGLGMEVIRLTLPEGKQIPEHTANGEITVQCIEGQVEFHAHGSWRTLRAGDLMYLAAAEPHALRALEDSAVLLTRLVR